MALPPIRTVIIDDQAAMRQALAQLLDAEPDVQVVGHACDGEEGLKVVFQMQPELILLDLEMPRLDGFAFLRLLMAKRPTPVIVVSTRSGRESVFKALELGALEFVAKPLRREGTLDVAAIRTDLLAKIRLARRLKAVTLIERARAGAEQVVRSGAQRAPAVPVRRLDETGVIPDRLLCIGASTGGPTSILALLLALDTTLPISILITQHMPEHFTGAFAERLERATAWTVREARAGDLVAKGQVLVASGGFSLRVARDGAGLRVLPPTTDGECRDDGFVPSVDRMLEAAAAAFGQKVIAAILTGMSGEGVKGALAVHAAGGRVLAEAPESAIISSMPEDVIRSGAADEVVPLSRMAEAIRRLALSEPLPRRVYKKP